MLARLSRFGILIGSVVLMLGTATGPSLMADMATRGAMPAGHHHGGKHEHGPRPTESCCDYCLSHCSAPPPFQAVLSFHVLPAISRLIVLPTNLGRSAAPPVWYLRPFAQAPPALLL